MFKCHKTSGDNDSETYEINLPYYGGWSPDDFLIQKDKRLKVLDDQSISIETQRYTFTECLSSGDTKTFFHKLVLNLDICAVDYFKKVTKHTESILKNEEYYVEKQSISKY